MKVSKVGLDLIKKWEGFYVKAYLCPAKVATIGYGTTKYANGKNVKLGDTITHSEALKLLERQVNEHSNEIFEYVKIKLTQNQYDALASFHYNLGKHILSKNKTLTQYINNRDWSNVVRVMSLYNKANGKVLQGLVNRRKDETALFMKGLTSPTPSKKEDDELSTITSPALVTEINKILDDPKQRKLIIDIAIKNGYSKVWLDKLSKNTVSNGDILALATLSLLK